MIFIYSTIGVIIGYLIARLESKKRIHKIKKEIEVLKERVIMWKANYEQIKTQIYRQVEEINKKIK